MDILDYCRQQNKEQLHFWYRARKELIAGWLKKFYPVFSAKRKLFDLGCGCGAEIEELKKFGVVEAMEINPEAASQDFVVPDKFFNFIFYFVMKIETIVLLRGFSLPCGISLIASAKK